MKLPLKRHVVDDTRGIDRLEPKICVSKLVGVPSMARNMFLMIDVNAGFDSRE
jgi:hypothetical protein